eukprot:jgi/Mesvir1/21854/Mv04234-RA.1
MRRVWVTKPVVAKLVAGEGGCQHGSDVLLTSLAEDLGVVAGELSKWGAVCPRHNGVAKDSGCSLRHCCLLMRQVNKALPSLDSRPTWDEWKAKQKEEHQKRHALTAQEEQLMRSYKEQLAREREEKLAAGVNHQDKKAKKDKKSKKKKKKKKKDGEGSSDEKGSGEDEKAGGEEGPVRLSSFFDDDDDDGRPVNSFVPDAVTGPPDQVKPPPGQGGDSGDGNDGAQSGAASGNAGGNLPPQVMQLLIQQQQQLQQLQAQVAAQQAASASMSTGAAALQAQALLQQQQAALQQQQRQLLMSAGVLGGASALGGLGGVSGIGALGGAVGLGGSGTLGLPPLPGGATPTMMIPGAAGVGSLPHLGGTGMLAGNTAATSVSALNPAALMLQQQQQRAMGLGSLAPPMPQLGLLQRPLGAGMGGLMAGGGGGLLAGPRLSKEASLQGAAAGGKDGAGDTPAVNGGEASVAALERKSKRIMLARDLYGFYGCNQLDARCCRPQLIDRHDFKNSSLPDGKPQRPATFVESSFGVGNSDHAFPCHVKPRMQVYGESSSAARGLTHDVSAQRAAGRAHLEIPLLKPSSDPNNSARLPGSGDDAPHAVGDAGMSHGTAGANPTSTSAAGRPRSTNPVDRVAYFESKFAELVHESAHGAGARVLGREHEHPPGETANYGGDVSGGGSSGGLEDTLDDAEARLKGQLAQYLQEYPSARARERKVGDAGAEPTTSWADGEEAASGGDVARGGSSQPGLDRRIPGHIILLTDDAVRQLQEQILSQQGLAMGGGAAKEGFGGDGGGGAPGGTGREGAGGSPRGAASGTGAEWGRNNILEASQDFRRPSEYMQKQRSEIDRKLEEMRRKSDERAHPGADARTCLLAYKGPIVTLTRPTRTAALPIPPHDLKITIADVKHSVYPATAPT